MDQVEYGRATSNQATAGAPCRTRPPTPSGFVRSRAKPSRHDPSTTTAYVAEALRAGAAGFLLKTTEPRALLQALRDCAEGRTALSPAVRLTAWWRAS